MHARSGDAPFAEELPEFSAIRAEVSDQVGWLTLNRPERRNALSPSMLTEIVTCLRVWSQGSSVKVIVIDAEGPSFGAGLDRDWLQSESADDRRALQFASSAFHRELFGLRIPAIAMVHGHAVGTSMDLAVMCDLRVASDDAIFGHPEILLGGPPLFTPLRSVVGDGWARELCLTGRTITATEAERIGLVNRVVERAQLNGTTRELAQQIARVPHAALVATKSFFRVNPGIDDFIHTEHDRLFETGLTYHDLDHSPGEPLAT
jgi:enoyl-CoA hydratase/carnithine racemase